MKSFHLLDTINSPQDLKRLSLSELGILSTELRQFIIENLSKTGGHLASNLGVVELTVALHYIFDSPHDKLVWDVGHQTYVHKILTGRKNLFHTIRQFKGISGFPKAAESLHDAFDTGHSSTSISAALGMARARDILGERHRIAAIIGDASLTGGMAFEALNDAGHSHTDIIVILNDNQMSIGNNVGAMARHLTRIRSNPKYTWLKTEMSAALNKVPFIGKCLVKLMEKFKKALKYFLVPGIIFEELGFTYLGPVDGHNILEITSILERAVKIRGPKLIHCLTIKGKGFDAAETSPDLYHSVPPFNSVNGNFTSNSASAFSNAFGEGLIKLAEKDKRVVAITAAMAEGTGISEFKTKFPARFFDVGIAEQHAVTLAAGMAKNGLRPYVAIYSTFMQRAYDQILHDVCIQKLPVVFALDRAGLSGEDGETHHGMFDVNFLRHIPNLTILSPKDTVELSMMLEASLKSDGPIAIRYEKAQEKKITGFNEKNTEEVFLFNWEILEFGSDLVVISYGRMLEYALQSCDLLRKIGINATIVNARILKPLDLNVLNTLDAISSKWVTVEDNALIGGFGSAINDYAIEKSLKVDILNIGLPDVFVPHGKVSKLLEHLGLDSLSIADKIKHFVKDKAESDVT